MARLVLKLGSSVVADDRGDLRADALAAVRDAVLERRAAGDEVVVVSSGAIAVGVPALGLAARPAAMAALQACSAVGQLRLYRAWEDLLADAGLRTAQLLLTTHDLGEREAFVGARRTLQQLLDWGVVPVVNENDTTTTEEISFGDNDLLAAQVAILVGAERLVLLTSTDGLYTADPRRDPDAALVAHVEDVEWVLATHDVGATTSTHGTGGMRSKALAAQMAGMAGIPTSVGSGLRPGAVSRLLAGEPEGTSFAAGPARWSSFKLWLRFAKPSRGTVEVDAGAARALRDGGTSLLPVGVSGVRGEFRAGDAVEIEHEGALLAKGLSGYTAGQLRAVMGQRTATVRERLPRAPEEAVHRDQLVLA